MTSTGAVRVKKALRDLLVTAFEDTDTDVHYSFPGEDRMTRSAVWFGSVDTALDPASMKTGPTFWHEVGDLDVWCAAVVPGGTVEDAEDLCVEAADVVADVVASNRNIGNATASGVTVSATFLNGSDPLESGFREAGGAGGGIAWKKLVVRWDARLTP